MADGEQLRKTAIYRAMNRPNLILGGERELVLLLGLMASVIGVASASWEGLIIGILIWVFGYPLLRMMAKHDPFMARIFLRHRRYQKFYPARGTPYQRQ